MIAAMWDDHNRRAFFRPLAALLLLLFAAPAPAAQQNIGVSSFDRIRVDGPYRVTVVTGRGASAKAEGDRHALDRLSLRVEGRTLLIRTGNAGWGNWPGETDGPVTIALSTPDLYSAWLNGSGTLEIDRLKGPRVDVSLNGAGTMTVGTVATDQLRAVIAGSGRLTIGGTTRDAQVVVQGSGDLDARGMAAADVQLTVQGAANVRMQATRSARITAGGSGEVIVTGKAACTVRQLGSGPVACGK